MRLSLIIETTADQMQDLTFLIMDLGWQEFKIQADGTDGIKCILDGEHRGETSSFWMERLQEDLEAADFEFELTREWL